MTVLRLLVLYALMIGPMSAWAQQKKIWLDEMELDHIGSGWKVPQARKAVDYDTIRIAGKRYAHGVGTHATCLIHVELHGSATRFYTEVGLDDKIVEAAAKEPGTGIVSFSVLADGKLLYYSDIVRPGDKARIIDLDVTGVKNLYLLGDQMGGSHHDHINFADAYFLYEGRAPNTGKPPVEKEYVLTPPAPAYPLYNGATRYGVRPGSPVQIYLAFSGQGPLTISQESLPTGLRLDPKTRMIEGTLAKAGTYPVTVRARNKQGSARVTIKVVAGDTLALTPPMGWNSWNCWGMEVTAERVRQAAVAMKTSGLADYGFTYINIDDGWQGGRAPDGTIESNAKFPSMRRLADTVHSLGLKVGLYSSPGPQTCGKLEGSYQHEAQDAATYASWGFDFLKYDLCSYGPLMPRPASQVDHMKPYVLMGGLLRDQRRDIVLSLCQYGMARVPEWGARTKGSLWRTTGDIIETWESVTQIITQNATFAPYVGPGRFNDPDMLVVGWLGWGNNLHKTRLTPSEQYYHISMWSLMAAPLLLGCDLTRLDAFTLGLLTNREVLAINQDELGRQATRSYADTSRYPWAQERFMEVWQKPLANGDRAVGIFNRGNAPMTYTIDPALIGLRKGGRVRDVWRQKDLPSTTTLEIPRHGCVLLRVSG